MFSLFHLKSTFSASLSRSHYRSIKNLKTEVQNAKSCHGYIYTVKMVIKIKLKGLNAISLLTFTCSKSTPKPCSTSTIETSKCCQRRHSDVSIVNSFANFEHVISGPDINLKVSKQWTVLGHSMLVETV